MAVVPGSQLTVTDSAAVQVDSVAETDASGTSNSAAQRYGHSVIFKTSGACHFGGSSAVTNTGANRGALLDAGTYAFDLSNTDHIYLIAPSGQSVTVERLQVGV